MVKKSRSPVTYTRMKGIISYFSALIRDRKHGSTDLLQKLGTRIPIYQHSTDSECFLRPEASLSDESAAAAKGKPSHPAYMSDSWSPMTLLPVHQLSPLWSIFGKMGKRAMGKDLSDFDKGQNVMPKRPLQIISKTAGLLGCSWYTVVSTYQKWSKCFTSTAQELQRSQVSAADFDYLKVIGTGSFGEVLLAKYKANNRYYAVKVLKKHIILKKEAEGNVICERNVLVKTLNHPFLVRLHFSFQTKERLCLVLDYASGGELFYHLQKERVFREPRATFYAAEMASALGYLHSLHIIYRDLKPENILLDSEGHVVLTDFGLCKEGIVGRATTKTFCGTPEYLAPEVLQQHEYDRTVDWWGLGAVLHEMLYGLPPFYSADRIKMLGNIIYQPLVLKAGVSKAGKNFLKGLLNKDRSKRLGAKHDVDELKRHSFFSSIQWDDLVAKKIPPPFVPSLSGPDDLTNINPAFTRLPVPESLGVHEEAGVTFPGFSYVSENISSVSM